MEDRPPQFSGGSAAEFLELEEQRPGMTMLTSLARQNCHAAGASKMLQF
jgi:hypothetical protein